MRNPCRGVVTSEHQDDGGYRHHRGRDIGTRDLNSKGQPVWVYAVGRPVYAAFSGRWKKIVRWSTPGNRKSTWAPTRTGNGGLVANPDGEGNGYNHVSILSKWAEGDWINEGELIGHLDLSGNMSAPHLHFEMWSNWRDPYSDYSPKIVFDKYGVDTMDDPAATLTPASTTRKEWSDMASKAEISVVVREETRAVIREEIRDLPADVWAHLITTPEGKEAYASTLLAYGRRDAGNAAAHSRAASRVTEALAARSGMDRDEIAQIIQQAIADSVSVEGVLTVTSKKEN